MFNVVRQTPGSEEPRGRGPSGHLVATVVEHRRIFLSAGLAADFSPESRPGDFLGIWRFISDVGSAGGPLAVSFIVGVASLALAAMVTAAFGFTGATAMWLRVPETLRRGG
jgi:hypothetical protein